MNDTFSLKRFAWLFKKTLLERPVQLFGLIGLSLIISFLIYAILKNMVGFEEAQVFSFLLGFVGGGVFLASFVFSYFFSNASGSSYLTLPASTFEKWLCGILICGIIFPAIFLSLYHLMDLGFVSSYHNSLDPKEPFYREKYNSVFPFSFYGDMPRHVYVMFLNATGAMLIGSLYFNKNAFIKVALFVSIVYISGHFLNYFMAKSVLDNVNWALPYYCAFIEVGKERAKLMLPNYASVAVDICMIYIVPAIFCLTALVRLREKEF